MANRILLVKAGKGNPRSGAPSQATWIGRRPDGRHVFKHDPAHSMRVRSAFRAAGHECESVESGLVGELDAFLVESSSYNRIALRNTLGNPAPYSSTVRITHPDKVSDHVRRLVQHAGASKVIQVHSNDGRIHTLAKFADRTAASNLHQDLFNTGIKGIDVDHLEHADVDTILTDYLNSGLVEAATPRVNPGGRGGGGAKPRDTRPHVLFDVDAEANTTERDRAESIANAAARGDTIEVPERVVQVKKQQRTADAPAEFEPIFVPASRIKLHKAETIGGLNRLRVSGQLIAASELTHATELDKDVVDPITKELKHEARRHPVTGQIGLAPRPQPSSFFAPIITGALKAYFKHGERGMGHRHTRTEYEGEGDNRTAHPTDYMVPPGTEWRTAPRPMIEDFDNPRKIRPIRAVKLAGAADGSDGYHEVPHHEMHKYNEGELFDSTPIRTKKAFARHAGTFLHPEQLEARGWKYHAHVPGYQYDEWGMRQKEVPGKDGVPVGYLLRPLTRQHTGYGRRLAYIRTRSGAGEAGHSDELKVTSEGASHVGVYDRETGRRRYPVGTPPDLIMGDIERSSLKQVHRVFQKYGDDNKPAVDAEGKPVLDTGPDAPRLRTGLYWRGVNKPAVSVDPASGAVASVSPLDNAEMAHQAAQAHAKRTAAALALSTQPPRPHAERLAQAKSEMDTAAAKLASLQALRDNPRQPGKSVGFPEYLDALGDHVAKANAHARVAAGENLDPRPSPVMAHADHVDALAGVEAAKAHLDKVRAHLAANPSVVAPPAEAPERESTREPRFANPRDLFTKTGEASPFGVEITHGVSTLLGRPIDAAGLARHKRNQLRQAHREFDDLDVPEDDRGIAPRPEGDDEEVWAGAHPDHEKKPEQTNQEWADSINKKVADAYKAHKAATELHAAGKGPKPEELDLTNMDHVKLWGGRAVSGLNLGKPAPYVSTEFDTERAKVRPGLKMRKGAPAAPLVAQKLAKDEPARNRTLRPGYVPADKQASLPPTTPDAPVAAPEAPPKRDPHESVLRYLVRSSP